MVLAKTGPLKPKEKHAMITEIVTKPHKPRLKLVSFSIDSVDSIELRERKIVNRISVFSPLIDAARKLEYPPKCIRIPVNDGVDVKQMRGSIYHALNNSDILPEGKVFKVGVTVDNTELIVTIGDARIFANGKKPGRPKGWKKNKTTKELDTKEITSENVEVIDTDIEDE